MNADLKRRKHPHAVKNVHSEWLRVTARTAENSAPTRAARVLQKAVEARGAKREREEADIEKAAAEGIFWDGKCCPFYHPSCKAKVPVAKWTVPEASRHTGIYHKREPCRAKGPYPCDAIPGLILCRSVWRTFRNTWTTCSLW